MPAIVVSLQQAAVDPAAKRPPTEAPALSASPTPAFSDHLQSMLTRSSRREAALAPTVSDRYRPSASLSLAADTTAPARSELSQPSPAAPAAEPPMPTPTAPAPSSGSAEHPAPASAPTQRPTAATTTAGHTPTHTGDQAAAPTAQRPQPTPASTATVTSPPTVAAVSAPPTPQAGASATSPVAATTQLRITAPSQSMPAASAARADGPGAVAARPAAATRPTPAPASARSAPTEQVARSVLSMLGRNGGMTSIRLSPEALGDVRINLTVRDNQATLRLLADSPEARALLERSVDSLRSALDRQGLRVQQITVEPLNRTSATAASASPASGADNDADAAGDRSRGRRDEPEDARRETDRQSQTAAFTETWRETLNDA